MFKLQQMKLTTIEMTYKDFLAITNLIKYGLYKIADNEYPDRGENRKANIYGKINMQSLAGSAILDVKGDALQNNDDNSIASVLFLDMAIYSVVQMLSAISDEDLQREIWRRMAADLWKSDEHYGTTEKNDFIRKTIDENFIDRASRRRIMNQLQCSNKTQTLKKLLRSLRQKND